MSNERPSHSRHAEQAWHRHAEGGLNQGRSWAEMACVSPEEDLQRGQSWLGVLVVLLIAAAAVASWLSPLLPN